MNSLKTTIAVVIPVYNAKEFLEQAVSSVLEQPYPNISLVLVDDGSTDGSSRLCDELKLKSSRIQVIHQQNAGVSAARNAGIDYVLNETQAEQGRYLAFLDADDCWTEEVFDEKTVELLQNGHDLIGFQSCNCDADLEPIGVANKMESGLHPGGQDNVWLHAKQPFGAMLYSCRLLAEKEIRFFEELKYSEDKIFSMQCLYLAQSIYLQNKLLYLYRHTGHSAMSRRKFGIPYFAPIIDGYLKLDSMMRAKQGDLSFTISRQMASIYVMDMISEHFQALRGKKAVDRVLASCPDFVSVVSATGEYADLKPNEDYLLYIEHPTAYIMRNNWKGVIKLCRKIARKAHLLKS
ncbi:MAG: glycosyltransferase family 2 protein [Oscillospiraceae bacterium]|nr:glycosyltransferase family 2 protein [Oscillospiraceae bacterium]